MKRSPMFMNWDDKFSKNGHPTKSNLQIPSNPHGTSTETDKSTKGTELRTRHKYKYLSKLGF